MKQLEDQISQIDFSKQRRLISEKLGGDGFDYDKFMGEVDQIVGNINRLRDDYDI